MIVPVIDVDDRPLSEGLGQFSSERENLEFASTTAATVSSHCGNSFNES